MWAHWVHTSNVTLCWVSPNLESLFAVSCSKLVLEHWVHTTGRVSPDGVVMVWDTVFAMAGTVRDGARDTTRLVFSARPPGWPCFRCS